MNGLKQKRTEQTHQRSNRRKKNTSQTLQITCIYYYVDQLCVSRCSFSDAVLNIQFQKLNTWKFSLCLSFVRCARIFDKFAKQCENMQKKAAILCEAILNRNRAEWQIKPQTKNGCANFKDYWIMCKQRKYLKYLVRYYMRNDKMPK